MAHWQIKEFGQMTGVSVRTLHHYDKIDLLKPSIRQSNGYRLYSENDLLKLQRILALKFFGLGLDKIKSLMEKNDNALLHLRAQKQYLQDEVEHLQVANQILDTVINNLEKGTIDLDGIVNLIQEYKMRNDNYFDVNSDKQRKYEKFLLESGKATEKQIAYSRDKANSLSKEELAKMKEAGDRLFQKFSKAMDANLKPGQPEVQELIQELYESICYFGVPDKEHFAGLGKLYCEHPDFRKFYEVYHLNMPEYLAEGMKIYAENVL